MKKLLLSIIFLTAFLRLIAQDIDGKGISFQGVARDVTGLPVIKKQVKIKAALVDVMGNNAYIETHLVTTDNFGLFSVVIG